jgi:hypothetical protein
MANGEWQMAEQMKESFAFGAGLCCIIATDTPKQMAECPGAANDSTY